MIRQPLSRRWRLGLGVASVLTLLAGYTVLSYTKDVATIPNWGQLWSGFLRVVTPAAGSGEIWIWVDAKATYVRLFAGLLVGVGGSIVLGVLMGCYSPVEAVLLPPMSFLAKVPPTAMLGVFFVVFGIDLGFFVAMIAFGTLPTLTQAIYEAARKDVPEELVYKASTLGASQPEIIWDVIFKHILPKLLESVRLQLGPAMVYLIAAEYQNGGGAGFGDRIRKQLKFDMSIVYNYLVFLGIAGFLMDQALIWTRRKLCPWYGE